MIVPVVVLAPELMIGAVTELPVNATAVIIPLDVRLVSVPTEVIFGCDAVVRLPATVVALIVVILPVGADMVFATIAPLAVIVPTTLAPEDETTNTFATPLIEVLTLPSTTGIVTLEVPLAIPELVTDPDNIFVHEGVVGVPMFRLISDSDESYHS